MPKKKPSEDEIVESLRKVDALTAGGMPISDAIAAVGISDSTYARWRKVHADVAPSPLQGPARIESSLRRGLPEPGEPSLPLDAELEGPRRFPIAAEPRWRPLRWAGIAFGCIVALGAGAFLVPLLDDASLPSATPEAGPQEVADPVRAEVDGLRHGLADVQAQLDAIKAEAASRTAAAAAAAPAVDDGALDRLRSDLKAQIDLLWKGAADDRAALETIKSRLDALATPVTREQLDALRRDLSDAVAAVETRRAMTAGEIGALRAALAAEVRRSTAALGALESQLARQGDRSADLERRRAADDARVAALERAAKQEERPVEAKPPPRPDPQASVPDELWMPYDMSIPAPEAAVDEPPRRPPDGAPRTTGSLARSEAQPIAVPAAPRVVLRYAERGPGVAARVSALQKDLDKRGFVVTNAPGGTAGAAANTVAFFHAQDRAIAAEIAATLPKASVVQRQPSSDESLPPPGSIEIAIVE